MAEEKEKKGFFARLKAGLAKTRDNMVESFTDVFGASHIDDDFYENLEETFIMADMGYETTEKVIEGLKQKVEDSHIKEPAACKELVINIIKNQMSVDDSAYDFENKKSVVLVIGVNGVGKTTTAINLSACIAQKGKKVLLIDSDPQGNATSGFGFDKRDIKQCIYDAIISDVPMQDVIKHTAYKGLDLVPATIQLAGAEIELVSLMNREGRLKNSLERVKHNYDYVIIDCPPSLGLLTINGLTAASSVMIPIQCEFYALEGVTMLMNTIQLVQRNLNPALKLEGVLMTMYDSRTNLSQDVVNEVQKYFKTKMYQTIIPRNVRLSEAPSHGQPVIDYDSKSKGAQVYMDFAREVIEDE